MMWNRLMMLSGSARRLNSSSSPCTRISNFSGCPGYPAAVTIATSMPLRMSVMMCSIIALSVSKWCPSAYSVPSASKVMSLSLLAELCTCAMPRMWRISAKFGVMYLRRLSAKWSSYSRKACVRFSGRKMGPMVGMSRLSVLFSGTMVCSRIHRSILLITSAQVCVLCMSVMNSMKKSCSFRCPFRRSILASVALLARMMSSGSTSSWSQ
mmetsp:Transcript_44750/g.115847  ORF Transcript_44750/g.115847 Transcript_44750/m.115847 type:complete len:210 (+) Transcript_44750:376-1005(+)